MLTERVYLNLPTTSEIKLLNAVFKKFLWICDIPWKALDP